MLELAQYKANGRDADVVICFRELVPEERVCAAIREYARAMAIDRRERARFEVVLESFDLGSMAVRATARLRLAAGSAVGRAIASDALEAAQLAFGVIKRRRSAPPVGGARRLARARPRSKHDDQQQALSQLAVRP